jgi:two-component system, response regulator RegA
LQISQAFHTISLLLVQCTSAVAAKGEKKMSGAQAALQSEGKGRLLVVDDDDNHCWALMRSFEKRGYAVNSANCVPQALRVAETWRPQYTLLDLRMPGPSGLTLISRLRIVGNNMRIVVITGYASIATAVEAIKLGAVHYLTKPADADSIEAAFHRDRGNESIATCPQRLSVDRLAWEHIQGVLTENQGNISAAARALGMHRRTLQRKLCRFPARG